MAAIVPAGGAVPFYGPQLLSSQLLSDVSSLIVTFALCVNPCCRQKHQTKRPLAIPPHPVARKKRKYDKTPKIPEVPPVPRIPRLPTPSVAQLQVVMPSPSPSMLSPPSSSQPPPPSELSDRKPRVSPNLGKKVVPVTKDIPSNLAELPIDTLYEEIFDDMPNPGAGVELTWNVADPTTFENKAATAALQGAPSMFKCKICDHAFLKKHTVITHLKTHLGQKPFACTFEGWYVGQS